MSRIYSTRVLESLTAANVRMILTRRLTSVTKLDKSWTLIFHLSS